MIEKIRLQNFKLHKDTTLEIKPITIFIGQNNSGKSSIFQALQSITPAFYAGVIDLASSMLLRRKKFRLMTL